MKKKERYYEIPNPIFFNEIYIEFLESSSVLFSYLFPFI